MMTTLYLLLALTTSEAAGPPPCTAFPQLKKKMESCDDNFELGRHVVSCMNRYTEEVRTRREKIRTLLSQYLASAKSGANKDDFQNTNIAYSDLQKELDALILTGTVAQMAVNGFLDELYHPEDSDNPKLTGMSTAEYLSKEPCFAVPRSVISDASNTFTRVVQDLTKAKAATKNLAMTSGKFSNDASSAASPTVNAPSSVAPSAKGADASGSNISDTTRKK